MLLSTSLNSCQKNSRFEASLFNVVYTPSNNSASIDVVATISVQGKATFSLAVSVYGYQLIQQDLNPCNMAGLEGICPLAPGKQQFTFTVPVPASSVKDVPGIAFTIPDLDASVRVKMNLIDTKEQIACVEARISNGKTVDLKGVKWATAIIAGLALLSSAAVSGLGHLNTAAHVAANSLSLFGYFQAQAIIGLTGVHLPPIVQAWTQNFQWSMGIIHVTFMQNIFTWYQRATGGTPSTLFSTIRSISVQVEKRSVDIAQRGIAMLPDKVSSSTGPLMKRAGNIVNESGSFLVVGIQRVAFRAKIESTNLFLTGFIFFSLFVIFTLIGVVAFKGILELFASKGLMAKDKFLEFRKGWRIILKGIMFRVCLIGFPQVAILCLWELTQIDSPALAVLAVALFLAVIVTLGWGASKVIRIARRSIAMHRNPAYILFSDPQALNKWGFLYIQFRASAYFFVVPVLGYVLIKAMFVAFGQRTGLAQAIGFLILELAALIACSVMRPWMDKSTNSFNIAIYSVNFINAICLLVFSNVFGAPGLVIGVVGVVFFILNAAFSLVLLLMVIISTTITFFRKNPDAKYQYMADDRASFMRSQTHLTTTTELDALAATARGDKGGYKSRLDLEDDGQHLRPHSSGDRSASPASSLNASVPMFPASREQSPFRSASPVPSMESHGAAPPSYRQVNNSR